MLEIKQLCKTYHPGTVTELKLFDRFDLTVPDGQFVSIVGSNGSGKTSLLNLLCGSIPLDSGDICLDGRSLRRQRAFQRYAAIGRVYQDPSLGTCPNLTLRENLSLADNKGKRFGLTFGVDKKRTAFYRERLSGLGLGLEDKLDVKMGALSGGQRQAVALLMATLAPLDLLILDEHTAALDPKTAETIMALTGRVVQEKGLTALMVTHNLRYALEYGDRLLMLDRGKIVLDKAGEEKAAMTADEILRAFGQLSMQ